MFKILAVLCLFCSVAYAMDCSFGTSSNAVEKFLQKCPSLVSSEDDKYCCPRENEGFRCCDLTDFVIQWLVAAWPIILLVLLICTILSCVCCCLRHSRCF